jgi:DNA (cytosine-5)-methyltransferase 1
MMRYLDGFGQSVDSHSNDTDHWHNHFYTVKTTARPIYIDLFAGCGGLSLGLERAGFHLALAVEKSPMAAETFYHNFIKRLPDDKVAAAHEWAEYLELPVSAQVERGLLVNEVQALLDTDGLLDDLREQEIDLVAGGPPCQGFSMAGRRNPDDIRNKLPWQFLEVVERLRPKAVIIENVVGIGQDFVKSAATAPFAQLRLALEATTPGYVVQPMRVNAMHFGVPEHRPRMLLVGLRADLAGRHGLTTGLSMWRSDELETPLLAPQRRCAPPRTVEDALWDLVDDCDGSLRYAADTGSSRYCSLAGEFAALMRLDPSWLPPSLPEAVPAAVPLNRTQRKHAPDVALRFQLYQYLQSQGLKSNLLNIPMDAAMTVEERERELRLSLLAADLPAIAPDGTVLARNLDEMVSLIMRRGTKKHSQRPLRADQPSPTVMSLPDDFVHHIYPRTLTVREMARLQSFPDHFEFRAKETTGSDRRRFEVPQYTQVGNAVPPMLAEAVGRCVFALITRSVNQIAQERIVREFVRDRQDDPELLQWGVPAASTRG